MKILFSLIVAIIVLAVAYTSGDPAGPRDQVVGYGAWMFA